MNEMLLFRTEFFFQVFFFYSEHQNSDYKERLLENGKWWADGGVVDHFDSLDIENDGQI